MATERLGGRYMGEHGTPFARLEHYYVSDDGELLVIGVVKDGGGLYTTAKLLIGDLSDPDEFELEIGEGGHFCQNLGEASPDAGNRYAQIKASNVAGSAYSERMLIVVAPDSVPNAPANVAGTSDANASSVVTWDEPEITLARPVTGYTVYAFKDSDDSVVDVAGQASGSSPHTYTGLTNGTVYYFKVAAVNAMGEGTLSAASGPATPATVPGAPTLVVGTDGAAASSSVSWTAPVSDGGNAITGYTIKTYAVSDDSELFSDTDAASPFVKTGLGNVPVYFKVAATNGIGTGALSVASDPVTPIVVPGAPTSVAGTTDNAQSSVSWVAPASTGGSAITGYQIKTYKVSDDSVLHTDTDAASPFVRSLVNDTAVYFKVAAINAAGTGPESAASANVTPTAP